MGDRVLESLVSHWYFHLPNYALAVMQYATIGRLILSFFVDENWSNYIWRGFKTVSAPAVEVVRVITPRICQTPLVLIFTILWLQLARIALLFTMASFGLAPTVQG